MNRKCALFDLDGTLFETGDVNFHAYQKALEEQGYSLNYDYFCKECNGRHYTTFLPVIIGENKVVMEIVHRRKKELYHSYLEYAKPNKHLLSLIQLMKADYNLAVVTTASRKNTCEILEQFDILDCFDLIITQEDVTKTKPDPEGFLKAMAYFQAKPEDTLIFEDSRVGIEAALASGALVIKIERGF